MSSTAIKHLGAIACACLFFCAGQTFAAQAGPEAKVVAKLYKDFGWQAFAAQPDLFGEGLGGQSKASLERYFAPSLAGALAEDFACQARTREICKLDFDPLFDSQDPRVTDLSVEQVSGGTVRVQFKDPVTDATTRIDFKLVMVGGKWRIDDIVYAKARQPSLKTVLFRKIP